MSIREGEFARETDADDVERLLLLVEASGRLLGSPRVDAVMPAVLEVAQRILAADGYALWVCEAATETWRLELAAGLSGEYQVTATEAVARAPRTIEMTEAFAIEDVDRPEWVTEQHRRAYAREGIRSLLALPLRVRGTVAGTLVFYYREPHRFQASERRLADALSGVAASAIATAELVEGQSRTSEERRFVVEASEILSSSLDYETTLTNVAALAVPRFADWCTVDLAGPDGTLQRLAVAHADPAKVRFAHELAERYPEDPSSPRGARAVVESGESQLVQDIPDELLVAATEGRPGLLEIYRELGLRSVMIVPLVARGRTLGALTFVAAESGRRYGRGDLALVESLARNAALAVDNARLLREAERKAAELEFLAGASIMLAGSLDYDVTLANVASLAVPRLGDWCAIDLFEEDAIRRIAVAHADPARAGDAEALRTRFAPSVDDPVGPGRVFRTGEPMLLEEIPAGAFDGIEPERKRLLESLGMRSVIVVPLPSRARLLGSLTLISAESGRSYDAEDLDFAQHVARRIAAAVDNALLYRQAQEAFRAAEDSFVLLDTLLGTAPIGVFFVDTGLRYVRVNEALAELNGIPVDEHIGRRPDEAVPALGRISAAYLRRVLESGVPETDVELEWDFPGPPPERRVRLGSYYPVRRSDGEIIGVGGVSIDITERKRSERILRFMAEASELLASTLDVEETLGQIASLVVPALAGQCIVDLLEEDGSTRCVAVAHLDPERESLLREVRRRYPPSAPGHPVQTALRSGEAQLLPELTGEAMAAMAQSAEHLEQIRVLGNTSGIVVPLVARGRTLGAITLGTLPPQPPYRKADLAVAGELARRAAVAVDNARLYREAEERAQASLALAYVGDGVALVDDDGVVRVWNRAAAELTGIPAAELVGRPAATVPGWNAIVEQVPVEAGPSTRAVTLPLELSGRELWLSISAVRYPDGTVYAFRDLTEERSLERMRTDFVSTVSHELRTPLAAIYGAALTLRRPDLRLQPDQRGGLLDVIASESDRLARIVNDILWASRVDARSLQVTLERCDVGALVSEVAAAARLHLPANVELIVRLAPDPAFASCDADKLRQVLTNLVDNAVKYSPDGGPVEVAVTVGERVRIAVRDGGLGIPLPEQARIFEKFYRLDPNLTRGVGGTGLGLYICRELVRMMDGAIWVVSREGVGSTFTVELRGG